MTKENIVAAVKYMLAKQVELNENLDPDWGKKDWDFDLAAQVEAAELADHLGYKWWKDKEPDWRQAQMEVIDIWHFVLSKVARHWLYVLDKADTDSYAQGQEILADAIHGAVGDVPSAWLLKPTDKSIALAMVKQFNHSKSTEDKVIVLVWLGNAVGLPFHTVKLRYIAKAALNQFRWANGYKEGEYHKNWYTGEGSKYDTTNYQEDNEVLTTLVDEIETGLILADWEDAPAIKIEELIYNTLDRMYRSKQAAIDNQSVPVMPTPKPEVEPEPEVEVEVEPEPEPEVDWEAQPTAEVFNAAVGVAVQHAGEDFVHEVLDHYGVRRNKKSDPLYKRVNKVDRSDFFTIMHDLSTKNL